jgi:hypothetical protein
MEYAGSLLVLVILLFPLGALAEKIIEKLFKTKKV